MHPIWERGLNVKEIGPGWAFRQQWRTPMANSGSNAGILVKVNYQGATVEQTFPPNTKMNEVLDWAALELGIDPALVTELDLAVTGSEDPVSETKNLGSVAQGAKDVCLDLVRGPIANG